MGGQRLDASSVKLTMQVWHRSCINIAMSFENLQIFVIALELNLKKPVNAHLDIAQRRSAQCTCLRNLPGALSQAGDKAGSHAMRAAEICRRGKRGRFALPYAWARPCHGVFPDACAVMPA